MANEWLLINLIAYPLKVLGVGERVGIWTQGCTLKCKGCMSKHTWEFDTSKKVYINDIIKTIKNYPTKSITISGGEPLEQKIFFYF